MRCQTDCVSVQQRGQFTLNTSSGGLPYLREATCALWSYTENARFVSLSCRAVANPPHSAGWRFCGHASCDSLCRKRQWSCFSASRLGKVPPFLISPSSAVPFFRAAFSQYVAVAAFGAAAGLRKLRKGKDATVGQELIHQAKASAVCVPD